VNANANCARCLEHAEGSPAQIHTSHASAEPHDRHHCHRVQNTHTTEQALTTSARPTNENTSASTPLGWNNCRQSRRRTCHRGSPCQLYQRRSHKVVYIGSGGAGHRSFVGDAGTKKIEQRKHGSFCKHRGVWLAYNDVQNIVLFAAFALASIRHVQLILDFVIDGEGGQQTFDAWQRFERLTVDQRCMLKKRLCFMALKECVDAKIEPRRWQRWHEVDRCPTASLVQMQQCGVIPTHHCRHCRAVVVFRRRLHCRWSSSIYFGLGWRWRRRRTTTSTTNNWNWRVGITPPFNGIKRTNRHRVRRRF
jgi:hypothetical protein